MRMQTGHFTRWKPDWPAAAWYDFILFTTMLHTVQHGCEQAWDLPPCRRRGGPFIQAHAGVGTDRVSPINNRQERQQSGTLNIQRTAGFLYKNGWGTGTRTPTT